jgi:hypothetical protein
MSVIKIGHMPFPSEKTGPTSRSAFHDLNKTGKLPRVHEVAVVREGGMRRSMHYFFQSKLWSISNELCINSHCILHCAGIFALYMTVRLTCSSSALNLKDKSRMMPLRLESVTA